MKYKIQWRRMQHSALLFGIKDIWPGNNCNESWLVEEIFMDRPQGLENKRDECLLLVKTIYGPRCSSSTLRSSRRSWLIECSFKTVRVTLVCLWRRRNTWYVPYLQICCFIILPLGPKDAWMGYPGNTKAWSEYWVEYNWLFKRWNSVKW